MRYVREKTPAHSQLLGFHPSVASRDLPAQLSQAPWEATTRRVDTCPSSPQISIPGSLCTAILPGLGGHLEHEITILAYYRDGAHSDPVSFHYSPRR